jgi:TRAP-type C4-dicarboxylate transport system permease small subunit
MWGIFIIPHFFKEAKGESFMSNATHRWRRVLESIPLVLVWIGAISVLCMAILLCYDVAMRYFFNAPTSWAIEIARYLMLATVFLPLAYVQQMRQHIKVELFMSHLPVRVRNIISTIVVPVLTLIVNGVLLWQVGKLAWKHLTRGTVSATILRLPLFPFSMILVVAFFAAVIVVLFQIRKAASTANESSWHASATSNREKANSHGENSP